MAMTFEAPKTMFLLIDNETDEVYFGHWKIDQVKEYAIKNKLTDTATIVLYRAAYD